jgi:hypothetical protein
LPETIHYVFVSQNSNLGEHLNFYFVQDTAYNLLIDDVCIYLSISISCPYLSDFIFLSVFLCLYLSLFLSVSLLNLSVSISMSLTFCVYLSICLYLFVFPFLLDLIGRALGNCISVEMEEGNISYIAKVI